MEIETETSSNEGQVRVIGPKESFFESLKKYDYAFVRLLAFQYFNQGSKAMLYLAVQDYFKSELKLEPGYIATLRSLS